MTTRQGNSEARNAYSCLSSPPLYQYPCPHTGFHLFGKLSQAPATRLIYRSDVVAAAIFRTAFQPLEFLTLFGHDDKAFKVCDHDRHYGSWTPSTQGKTESRGSIVKQLVIVRIVINLVRISFHD